jgi:hypothetical protein
MATPNYLRLPAYAATGVGVAATIAIATERLWPLFAPEIPPKLNFYPSTRADSNELVLAFHGMQSDQHQFGPLLGYLRDNIGDVVLAECGSDSRVTAQRAIAELERRGLTNRSIWIMGVSAGTVKLVNGLRAALRRHGISVMGVMIISGPGAPHHIIWPSRKHKYASRILRGGPLAMLIWRQMCQRGLAAARAETDPAKAAALEADAVRVSKIPAATMATCGLMLHKGARLRRNEFEGVPALVIERTGDPLIERNLGTWTIGFPNADYHFIGNYPGHATLGDCVAEYESAITKFVTRVRQDRQLTSAGLRAA